MNAKLILRRSDGSYQVVTPSNQFDGDWVGLVDHLTGSDTRRGQIRYDWYNVQRIDKSKRA